MRLAVLGTWWKMFAECAAFRHEKENFIWNSANVHIRKKQTCKSVFWICKSCLYFAYLLHLLTMSEKQRLSQLFWGTVHPVHHSVKHRKSTTRTTRKLHTERPWVKSEATTFLLWGCCAHHCVIQHFEMIIVLFSSWIFVWFWTENFTGNIFTRKKKQQPQKIKTKTKSNGGEMQWGTIRAFFFCVSA